MERCINSWYIDEDDVLTALTRAGYKYIAKGNNWYDSDVPISANASLQIASGRMLHSHGSRLSFLSKKEIEQKEIDAFDKRYNDTKSRRGK